MKRRSVVADQEVVGLLVGRFPVIVDVDHQVQARVQCVSGSRPISSAYAFDPVRTSHGSPPAVIASVCHPSEYFATRLQHPLQQLRPYVSLGVYRKPDRDPRLGGFWQDVQVFELDRNRPWWVTFSSDHSRLRIRYTFQHPPHPLVGLHAHQFQFLGKQRPVPGRPSGSDCQASSFPLTARQGWTIGLRAGPGLRSGKAGHANRAQVSPYWCVRRWRKAGQGSLISAWKAGCLRPKRRQNTPEFSATHRHVAPAPPRYCPASDYRPVGQTYTVLDTVDNLLAFHCNGLLVFIHAHDFDTKVLGNRSQYSGIFLT